MYVTRKNPFSSSEISNVSNVVVVSSKHLLIFLL